MVKGLMGRVNFIIEGQVPAQKNSKRISYNRATGKPFIRTEERVKVWQEIARLSLLRVKPIHGTVDIEMSFYNKDKRKRDIDNMVTSVLDALKNRQIIDDDNCFVVRKVTGEFMGVDPTKPCVEVSITHVDTP